MRKGNIGSPIEGREMISGEFGREIGEETGKEVQGSWVKGEHKAKGMWVFWGKEKK